MNSKIQQKRALLYNKKTLVRAVKGRSFLKHVRSLLTLLPTIVLVLVVLKTMSYSQLSNSVAATNQQIFDSLLQQLIDTALRDNPGLKATYHKIEASQASIAIQKGLEPPQFALEFFQAPISSFPNPLKEQMEIDYSLQQMIPFPGKLSAMAAVAQANTAMLKWEKETAEQELIKSVKEAFFELYLVYRKIEINKENLELIAGFIETATKQYELGMGKQSDILAGQTQLSSLLNINIVLEQNKQSMQAMINGLTSRQFDSPVPFIPQISPAIDTMSLSELLSLARKNRPELKAMEAAISMQQAEVNANRQERLPDFMVRGMYKQMLEGSDSWSLMLGLSLPFAPWSQNRFYAATLSSEARVKQAQQEYANMHNMVQSQIQDAASKVRSNRQLLQASQYTSIPQARQTLQSAIAAYQTGSRDFLMLIDIQKMLLMAQLDYHMAVMNLLSSRAQLERAIGVSRSQSGSTIEEINKYEK
ncbi:MAG: TolC family protein [Chitinivibrionales bacterium]|nr:TolC family protein [Chitinivibrionales bacterium]